MAIGSVELMQEYFPGHLRKGNSKIEISQRNRGRRKAEKSLATPESTIPPGSLLPGAMDELPKRT